MTIRRLVLRIAGVCHVNAWHMTLSEIHQALHVARELTAAQNPMAAGGDSERSNLPWLVPDGCGGWLVKEDWMDAETDP